MSLKEPKILIISWLTGSDFGGSELFWSEFIQRAPNNWKFGVFYKKPGKSLDIFKKLKRRGVSFFFNDTASPFTVEADPSNLMKLISEFKPDIIWINLNSHLPHDFIVNFPWPLDIPRIVMVQAVVPQLFTYGRNVERIIRFYSGSDLITFPTKRNLSDAERIFCKYLENAIVIGNFVDCKKFSSKNTQLSEDKWVLSCIARLEIRAKGQDILLESLSTPKLLDLPWELNLIGNGPDKDYLINLAHHFGISERVHCYTSQDIPNELLKSDLFVLPSHYEGLPFSLLEAMASGLPCIVSNVAGQGDLVREAGCGWIFSDGNPDELMEMLWKAWHNRKKKIMGENGRAFVEKYYESSKIMELMFSYLEGILSKKSQCLIS